MWTEIYLRNVLKIRKSRSLKNIAYTEETWLNEGHLTRKNRNDLSTLRRKNLRSLKFDVLTWGCTKGSLGKGKRLIITDTMTEECRVNGALWTFA